MSNGILFDLYTGSFPAAFYRDLQVHSPSDRALQLADDYRELASGYPPGKLEKHHRVPDELMDAMKELGLFGINIPAEYGGLGLSLSDYLYLVSVMAEKDMSLAIIPLAHLSIGVKGILLFGNEEQKRRYLTAAASGEMVFAYALTEPRIGSDARHIQTTASLSEDGTEYTLNGTKTYITNGGYADGFTVFARLDDGDEGRTAAFVVEANMEGVKVGNDLPKMGLAVSSTTPVMLRNVRVPKENMLGQEGDGFKIAMSILNYGRLGLGAASTGAIRKSEEDMRSRAASRRQFGMTIDNFPLIREKIGRAGILRHAVWGITALTAAQLEKDPLANLASEGSHAKLFGTTSAWEVLYEALQVAGGAGYLRTLPYEKRMRDFRVTTVFEGTSEIHSIYPPLSVMRSLAERLKGRGKPASLLSLLKLRLQPVSLSLPSAGGLESSAARQIRKNVKLIRTLLVRGMLRYGKEAAMQEFFLRRITALSINSYVLLGLLHSYQGAGEEERLRISNAIRYYVNEAPEHRREARSSRGTTREGLTVESFLTSIRKEETT
jgi:acyl-CoA dehydrogenase family protein 9